MKRVWLFALILCQCLLLGCSNSIEEDSQISNPTCTTSTAELKMPDAMKDLSKNPNIKWMAGMLAVPSDSRIIRKLTKDNFEVYTDPGEEIQATIIAQNGLDLSQQFDLMVFTDGVQTQFSVNGEWYWVYPMELTLQQCSVSVEFDNFFSLNMGRIDFVLSFAENPQADSHLVRYTIWIEQTKEYILPTLLFDGVNQRTGVVGSYGGESYNSWIWNESYVPVDEDFIGPKTLHIQEGETILLEAIAAKAGLYRTSIVVDGLPIKFSVEGNTYSYLDWESTGSNMLQVPIRLVDPPVSGSIYTITTPLTMDYLGHRILSSGKIELVSGVEE